MSKRSTMVVHLVHEYLEHRRHLGYQLRVEGEELLRFARSADHRSHDGRVPIYDLRHSFVSRRLLAWYEQEVDIDQKISWLLDTSRSPIPTGRG